MMSSFDMMLIDARIVIPRVKRVIA